MEDTQVIIVGAGPSGLTLGLCLADLQIRVRCPRAYILARDEC